MANKKLKILYLARYFQQETDEQHPKTLQEILHHLEGHGITDLPTLLQQSPTELKRVRNMTQEGLDEIEYQLGLLGLHLEQEP